MFFQLIILGVLVFSQAHCECPDDLRKNVENTIKTLDEPMKSFQTQINNQAQAFAQILSELHAGSKDDVERVKTNIDQTIQNFSTEYKQARDTILKTMNCIETSSTAFFEKTLKGQDDVGSKILEKIKHSEDKEIVQEYIIEFINNLKEQTEEFQEEIHEKKLFIIMLDKQIDLQSFQMKRQLKKGTKTLKNTINNMQRNAYEKIKEVSEDKRDEAKIIIDEKVKKLNAMFDETISLIEQKETEVTQEMKKTLNKFTDEIDASLKVKIEEQLKTSIKEVEETRKADAGPDPIVRSTRTVQGQGGHHHHGHHHQHGNK